MENNAVRMKWSSRVEFVVALIGYSIGMPEFWRVPYLTYRNGGGPFIIAYILLMLVCGFPLYFLELALSQYSGKGPWRFWDICPLLRGIGIAIAVINCIYSIAVAIVVAWSLEYLVNSFKAVLPWTNCDNEWNTPACFRDSAAANVTLYNSSVENFPFQNVTTMNTELVLNLTVVKPVDSVDEFWLYRVLRVSEGIHVLGAISAVLVVYMLVTRLLSSLSIVKSVASLGKVSYITALLPVVLILVIWVRALTLPGAIKGMLYFISADFRRFADPQLWIEASFQTFLTLGPGWGGLMMVGAHNKFRTNSFLASIISTSATLTFGLVNGLVVFSVLGVMSEEIGISIGEVMTSGGFSIGFIAYPKALSYFPLPQLWCVIFYIVLLLPGVDNMAILTEPFLLTLEETFPKQLNNRRIPLLAVVSAVMFLISIPFATQAGVYIFLLVDWYSGTWSVMLICMAECIVFAWIYGAHRIDRDIRLMFDRPLPVLIRISTAFIMPIFLTCLLLISIFTYKPPSFGEYTFPVYARALGWCFAFSSILPALSYCVWLVAKEKGTFRQRFKRLVKHTMEWAPANEKAEEIYRETEHLAGFTWRQLFWFNVTGRGGIVIKDIKADSVPML